MSETKATSQKEQERKPKALSSWINPSKVADLKPEDNSDDSTITFEKILAAAKRIEGGVVKSPCRKARNLSREFGLNLFIKCDFLQATGSFKERGALNALLQLSKEKRDKGVIAASAGNHALALAYHGIRLGIKVTVVMPTMAPLTKVQNCREIGAEVVIKGNNFQEAWDAANAICEQRGLTYIHGYDAPAVIIGQGTVGVEIMEQCPEVDVVIIPVGGAGLIAGAAMAIKHLKPTTEIIGVEPINYASLLAALNAGKVVQVDGGQTIADGLAVKQVGANALPLCQKYVDRVITVSEHAIALSVLRLVELEKLVVEGAGASSIAPIIAGMLPEFKGRNVVACLCGGNIDVTLLGRVIDHGLAADGRFARFKCWISDKPGGLAQLCSVIGKSGASIIHTRHERAFAGDEFSKVQVNLTVETRDEHHLRQVKQALESHNIPFVFKPFSGNSTKSTKSKL